MWDWIIGSRKLYARGNWVKAHTLKEICDFICLRQKWLNLEAVALFKYYHGHTQA